MFLCDVDHAKSGCPSPDHMLKSWGSCESCGKSSLTLDCHYIPADRLAQAQALAMLPNHNKYFIATDDWPWVETNKESYVRAERRAGFRNTLGMPDEPATAAWSSSGPDGHTVRGKIEYHP